MAEYRVAITIQGRDETVAFRLLETLERIAPEAGPVMVEHADATSFEFVLGTAAEDAVAAGAEIGERFRSALEAIHLGNVAIVGLTARAVPAEDLEEFPVRDAQPV